MFWWTKPAVAAPAGATEVLLARGRCPAVCRADGSPLFLLKKMTLHNAWQLLVNDPDLRDKRFYV